MWQDTSRLVRSEGAPTLDQHPVLCCSEVQCSAWPEVLSLYIQQRCFLQRLQVKQLDQLLNSIAAAAAAKGVPLWPSSHQGACCCCCACV
jgi:hypothetical protein